MQLTIIIVSYNVKYFLEHCLYAVQKAVSTLKAEIIVIDNASSDGSMEYLLNRFPEVVFIDNPTNAGYAKANNQGLKQAKGEYVLFLNPDTIVPEDCFQTCLRFMASHPAVGACGVKMIDGSGRFLPESKRAFPSATTSFFKIAGLTKLFPQSKRFARYYLGHINKDQNSEVDVLSGAFLFVKKAVLQDIGGFDEQFFMYGEDIDLSYRILQAGYLNYYLAETTIVHFKGESTSKGSLHYVNMFHNAMSLFVNKHFREGGVNRFNLVIQGSIWARAGVSAATNIFRNSATVASRQKITSIVIGNSGASKKAASILQKQIPVRRVSEKEPGGDLKKNIASSRPDEIVFCEGSLSYKQIIELMQHTPQKVSIKIFSEKSNTIIGSDSKDTNGDVLI